MAWSLADTAIRAVRGEFGEAVEYRPAAGGGPYSIVAPFDEAYQTVRLEGEVEVAATRPVLDVRLADLPVDPAEGDEVDVDGRTWTVEEVERDGRGSAKLYLHRRPAP